VLAVGGASITPYLRHRQTLVETAALHIQRMQKAVIQMNLQLPFVVSDITGLTGLRICAILSRVSATRHSSRSTGIVDAARHRPRSSQR
jgi:transposase